MMTELDALTVLRAAKGKRAATRALVERYQRPVFALVSRMVGRQPALVEDLAQETFLRVFKALPRFRVDGPAKLSSWILTIATRVTLDALKRRRPVLAEVPEAGRSARLEEQLAGRQALSAVERAVAELPEGQRAALVLRVFHDMDYAAIAEALEVDVGTVKSRIGRARARLREATEGMR